MDDDLEEKFRDAGGDRMPKCVISATRKTRIVVSFFAVFFGLTAVRSAQGQGSTVISGVVRSNSGEPAAGAYVKVRSAEWGIDYMVTSRIGGHYTTPNLPPGAYTVSGFGDGLVSKQTGPLMVHEGQPETVDLLLDDPQKIYAPPHRLTMAEYEALMPEGEAKQILLTHCKVCHSSENFVVQRADRQGWEQIVRLMSYYLQENSAAQQKYNAAVGLQTGALTDHEKGVILDYLSSNFGPATPPLVATSPHDPDMNLPATLRKDGQPGYVAMELHLQYHGATVRASSFVIDSAGTIWICEKGSGAFGRFNPKTLAYTPIYAPAGKYTDGVFAGLAIDPSGKVWFTSNEGTNSKWFEYDPQTKKIANTYDVPGPERPFSDVFFNAIVFPGNGTVWATSTATDRLIRLDTASKKATSFALRAGLHPFGITLASDKMIWYSGDFDDQMVKVDPNTGKRTTYDLPSPNMSPKRLDNDAAGNVWVITGGEGKLVKLDPKTAKMTEIALPTNTPGKAISVDRQGYAVWFAQDDTELPPPNYAMPRPAPNPAQPWDATISRYDLTSNKFDQFPMPDANEPAWAIQVDPTNRNRVWWCSRSGRIGYVEVMP